MENNKTEETASAESTSMNHKIYGVIRDSEITASCELCNNRDMTWICLYNSDVNLYFRLCETCLSECSHKIVRPEGLQEALALAKAGSDFEFHDLTIHLDRILQEYDLMIGG